MTPQTTLSDELSSGTSAMDRLHRDFFKALDKLCSSEDHEFSAGYSAFVSKVEQTFREEEQWMEDIDFPAWQAHEEQHARALSALHHVHTRVMNSEYEIGRQVAEQLLPQWFSLHMSTMDMTLALAMQMAEAGMAEQGSSGMTHEVMPVAP